MRYMTETALSALTGSRSGERLVAHVWYDGRIVAENLAVTDWTMSSDGSRQVRSQVSLTVADPDGTLAPWGVDDPLGVGGSKLQLVYVLSASESVDLGWFRLTGSEPAENWLVKTAGTRAVWISGGASIPIQADDLTSVAVADRLLAPQSPKSGATAISEVKRLMQGIAPVTVHPDVVDRAVATSLVIKRERMDAVEDLLTSISATHRMTGDGQLEVYPAAPDAPVWEVAGGENGVMISIRRSQSSSELYNAAISEGATPDGRQLIGRAFETTGPLRWEGPHWRRPIFYSSPMLTTQNMVNADAARLLSSRLKGRTVDLQVTCLPHPGLQPGDVVVVASPTVTGLEMPLTGVVRTINLRGGTGGPAPMTMTVECSYEDVQAVAAAIRRER